MEYSTFNIDNKNELDEIHTFVYNYYILLNNNVVRYEKDIFLSAITPPNYDKKYHLCCKDKGKIIGCIVGIPITIKYFEKELKVLAINFLVVHVDYRIRGIANSLIAEMIVLGDINGLDDAIYCGNSRSNFIVEQKLYIYPLNFDKMKKIGIFNLEQTKQLKQIYKEKNSNYIKEMDNLDSVYDLYQSNIINQDVCQLFTKEEFSHQTKNFTLVNNDSTIFANFTVLNMEMGDKNYPFLLFKIAVLQLNNNISNYIFDIMNYLKEKNFDYVMINDGPNRLFLDDSKFLLSDSQLKHFMLLNSKKKISCDKYSISFS